MCMETLLNYEFSTTTKKRLEASNYTMQNIHKSSAKLIDINLLCGFAQLCWINCAEA